MKTITILGDGGWGTALALLLSNNGHRVRVWGPFPEYLARIRSEGENPLYLPGVKLSPALEWLSDPAEAVADAALVVLAIPSHFFRSTLKTFSRLLPAGVGVLSVSKGLDADTRLRLSEVARELLGPRPVAVLSGPSHAEEVARSVPTAVVAASGNAAFAQEIQRTFLNPLFRVYTSDDVIGVELGGAFKNVIALAVGASDGIGFGDNTRAALITRGLAEISRLGCALGAHPETFAGLSGIGDLIVTCTSRWSRNRSVGERLGRGETMPQIMAGMKQVAEGVWNCGIARALAREKNVAAPITDEVYALVHEGKDPRRAVKALMSRDARPERDESASHSPP